MAHFEHCFECRYSCCKELDHSYLILRIPSPITSPEKHDNVTLKINSQDLPCSRIQDVW